MSNSEWIALGSLLITLVTIAGALLDRVGQRAKKSYAAEREFAHLKRNQEQMLQCINMLSEELDENTATLRELRMRIDFWLQKSDERN